MKLNWFLENREVAPFFTFLTLCPRSYVPVSKYGNRTGFTTRHLCSGFQKCDFTLVPHINQALSRTVSGGLSLAGLELLEPFFLGGALKNPRNMETKQYREKVL